MSSWNITHNGHDVVLLNGSLTLIKKHKQVPFGLITSLMSKMEEIEFPIEFTKGLDEIYFTYLKRGLHGDYQYPGLIRVGCNVQYHDEMYSTFIHEVGHHVDEMNQISEIYGFEKEYFAVGFENFWNKKDVCFPDRKLLKAISEVNKNRTKYSCQC